MAGGDLFQRKKRLPSPIKKESKKRKAEHKNYRQLCQELWDELVVEEKNICFFCNERMKSKEGFHHIRGRIRENYLERRYLFPAHNDCHVWHYHQANMEDLMKEKWYNGFLVRLKNLDTHSYYKELKKQDKAELF
jgi:hypothetical protein